MKKIIIIFSVVAGAAFSVPAFSQVKVSVNIGVQPLWGPTGYDHVDYYYMPDIDAYYSVSNNQYTYLDGGRWITAPALPPRFSKFDLYNAHKVVINEPTPWMRADVYRKQYAKFRGMHDQHPIRDSRENKYYENPGHPHHSEWHGHEEPREHKR